MDESKSLWKGDMEKEAAPTKVGKTHKSTYPALKTPGTLNNVERRGLSRGAQDWYERKHSEKGSREQDSLGVIFYTS